MLNKILFIALFSSKLLICAESEIIDDSQLGNLKISYCSFKNFKECKWDKKYTTSLSEMNKKIFKYYNLINKRDLSSEKYNYAWYLVARREHEIKCYYEKLYKIYFNKYNSLKSNNLNSPTPEIRRK